MDVFGIVVGVLLLGFVVWIMSRGGYSWKGGWPGERPNVVGIILLVVVVAGVVLSILSRG
jgi:hypothetical protein